jgi:hypothetical protein
VLQNAADALHCLRLHQIEQNWLSDFGFSIDWIVVKHNAPEFSEIPFVLPQDL